MNDFGEAKILQSLLTFAIVESCHFIGQIAVHFYVCFNSMTQHILFYTKTRYSYVVFSKSKNKHGANYVSTQRCLINRYTRLSILCIVPILEILYIFAIQNKNRIFSGMHGISTFCKDMAKTLISMRPAPVMHTTVGICSIIAT